MKKQTNKQTKRKQQQQQQQHSPQELHGNTGIDWSHWEQFVLIFSRSGQDLGEIMARSLIKSWQDLW